MLRFLQSSKHAINGIFYALRTERNVQIWAGVLSVNLLIAFLLQVSTFEFILILIVMFAIGIAEYLNTALEILSDRVTLEKDESIKRVKDVAAAATFIASTLAVIVSAIIYLPKIFTCFESLA